jgi:glycosyltransferase 2 family protein
MTKATITKKDALFQLIFLAIGVAMFVYVFKKFEFNDIVNTLKSAAIMPIIAVVFISLIGHFIRAYRWQLMMNLTGKTNFWNLLFSMQFAYFVSLAIPRVGEFIKCFTTAETEKKPVSFVFGTVMAERMVDFLIFAVLLGFIFIFQGEFLLAFWESLKANFSSGDSGSSKYMFIGVAVLLILVMYPMINKMTEGEKNEMNLMEGLKSVFKVENKIGFWLSTLLIYVCYFLTSYLLFFCFTETSQLTVNQGFLSMIGGTVSRMLPINGGGIGAYHLVIERLLSSFGVQSVVSVSYAFINHGIQFFFQIFTGLIALLYLSKKVDLKNIQNIKF